MRNTLLISICLGLFSISGPANAQETVNEEDICVAMSELAKNIMRARQKGAPMTQLMGLSKTADPSIGPLITELVIAAYAVPQYSVEKNRQREVVEFQNAVALECYRSGK